MCRSNTVSNQSLKWFNPQIFYKIFLPATVGVFVAAWLQPAGTWPGERRRKMYMCCCQEQILKFLVVRSFRAEENIKPGQISPDWGFGKKKASREYPIPGTPHLEDKTKIYPCQTDLEIFSTQILRDEVWKRNGVFLRKNRKSCEK